MNKKQLFVRVIAGGFLAYQGIALGKGVLADHPENEMMYLAFAGIFLICGIVFLASAVKRLAKGEYEEANMEIISYNKDEEVSEETESSLEE